MIEEAVNKVKETILLRAKDEVEAQTLKAKKIEDEYRNFKDGAKNIIEQERAKVKELKEQLQNLQTKYDKKRTEIPTFEHEIGEKVWIPHAEWDKELICPTCKGTGKITINDDQFGNIEISCPHCHNSEWKHKGDFVKRVSYWEYRPIEATIDCIYVTLDKNHELQTKYHLKPQYGTILSNLECEVFDFGDKESCERRCRELSKKSLEEAKQYIYSEEKDNDKV